MSKKTLVLGIGNMLRRDDGIGIHLLNRLRNLELPPDVVLLDGGTAGFDLLNYLEGINNLIVIDAMLTDDDPGTIHVLSLDQNETIKSERQFPDSQLFHQAGIMEIIRAANHLWGKIDATVIGIVPKDYLGYGEDLTPELNCVVAGAIQIILEKLKKKDPPK